MASSLNASNDNVKMDVWLFQHVVCAVILILDFSIIFIFWCVLHVI